MRKSFIIHKWCADNFCNDSLVSITVSGYSVTVASITEELHTSEELTLSGISLFTFTFGAAPLILAPLSEIWGRRWVYLGSAVIFWVFQIAQALAPNIQTMLVARFITGTGGSTGVSLVDGTLSDLFRNEDRGKPMGMFSFAAFGANGLGPIMFGYLAEARGFRLCFWIMFALSGLLTLAVALFQQETRESVLLSRKAKKLRKSTGDSRLVAQADEERASLAHNREDFLHPANQTLHH